MTKQNHVYGLEAGRCITRDGQLFVTLHKCYGVEPCAADDLARLLPLVLNSHEQLLEALRFAESILSAVECGHDKPLATGHALAFARKALASATGKGQE